MEKLKQLPQFASDQDIAAFMETHNGFELVDDNLAEIVETPEFQRKSQAKLASDVIL